MIYQIKNDSQYFYRISIKALVLDKNKNFLLLQEKDGSRSLPGGGLAHKDNYEKSLGIKIYKELCLKPSKINKAPCYFITAIDDYDHKEWKANIIFEVNLPKKAIILGRDEIAYRFFSKKDALKENLTKNTIEFVKVFDKKKHKVLKQK